MKSLRLSRKQFDSVVSVLGRIADALESDRFTGKAEVPVASAPQLKDVKFEPKPSRPRPAAAPAKPPEVKEETREARINVSAEGFHIAESGEEYEERVHHERDLALSLGVAPWSPDFQEAIDSMRRDIMKRQIVQVKNEETGEWHWVPKQFTEEEADQIVREAFQLAKAEANVRRETGDAHRVA